MKFGIESLHWKLNLLLICIGPVGPLLYMKLLLKFISFI